MLVIPAMTIRSGRCTRTAQGERGTEGMYPLEPASLARLWRGENAKALHVIDLDVAGDGLRAHVPLLRGIVEAVDIPVQLAARLASAEDVRIALEEIGAFRVVIDPDEVGIPQLEPLLERFGPRKIICALELKCAEIIPGKTDETDRLRARARQLEQAGVQRVVVRDISGSAHSAGPPEYILHSLVEWTTLSVTLHGSVRNYADLNLIQNLHPQKIDSVILGEALYSNAFPCQKIWRAAERTLMAQRRLL